MSITNRGLQAIVWGLAAEGVTPTAFRVLMRLCARVNGEEHRKDYDVWLTHKALAKESEISIAGVRRHLDELEEKGFIVRRPHHLDSGSQTANTYTVLVHGANTPTRSGAKVADLLGAQIEQGVGDESPDPCSDVSSPLLNGEQGKQLSKGTIEEDSPTTYGSGPPTLNFGSEIAISTPSLLDHVQAGWADLKRDHPRIEMPRVWNDSRKKAIVRRAKEVVEASNGFLSEFDVWDAMFRAIRGSVFLRGEAEPTRNYPTPFALGIDYILRPREFARTLEKAEINERDHQRTHTDTGRRIGPAEQALRAALQRMAPPAA